MGAAWLLLKLVHELAHGLVCKRYHGEVREMGLVFILFAPLAYVDVTSCWRFPSRWQRIHVAAAGMYVELALAGLAALVWARTDSESMAHLLHNLILMASISTILFNANPLMRFDGYYILSDLLQIPNLYSAGGEYVRQIGRWLFFGTPSDAPQILGFRGWITRCYGLAAAAWRVAICVSLVVTASVMFKGAGILLGIAGVACWFGQPLLRMLRNLYFRFHESRHTFARAIVVTGVLAGSVWAGLVWIPWPGTISAPVVVEYTDMSIVRSRISGFFRRIHVTDGQRVEAGQLLLELRNDDLENERRDLQLAIQQAGVRRRVAMDDRDAARAQVEIRNQLALEQRLVEVQRQYDGLQVRAPVAGRIVARDLKNGIGTYVTAGQRLLAVGDESRKELIVAISQDDVDEVLTRVGLPARFRIGARLAQYGTLDRVDPRATSKLPHPAMSAAAGGVLAVSPVEQEDGSSSVELLEPRFKAVIALPATTCQQLSCGQRGHAILAWSSDSFGQHVWGRFSKWLDQRLKAMRD